MNILRNKRVTGRVLGAASVLLVLDAAAVYLRPAVLAPATGILTAVEFALMAVVVLCVVLRGWADHPVAPESFRSIQTTGEAPLLTELGFVVPSRPHWDRLQWLPTKLAAAVGMTVLAAGMVGMPWLTNLTIANVLSFNSYTNLLLGIGILLALLAVGFAIAVVSEVRLQRSMVFEFNEGLFAAGYVPVDGSFSYLSREGQILLRDSEQKYGWWSVVYNGDRAELEWVGQQTS